MLLWLSLLFHGRVFRYAGQRRPLWGYGTWADTQRMRMTWLWEEEEKDNFRKREQWVPRLAQMQNRKQARCLACGHTRGRWFKISSVGWSQNMHDTSNGKDFEFDSKYNRKSLYFIWFMFIRNTLLPLDEWIAEDKGHQGDQLGVYCGSPGVTKRWQ